MSQMCPTCSQDNAAQASHCQSCGEPLLGLLGRNTMLTGRYRVTKVLGHGGMGAVYLAEDARIAGRRVALKENRHPNAQAFQSEVGVMVGLRHVGLPSVSDRFVGANGRDYLVMDFIQGETLEQAVTRRGYLSERETIALTEQLLDALAYLHQHTIVHRDVKPANIRLTPKGTAVLVDFGISKFHQSGALTQTWARGVGTPGFAPIEQYGRGTDARSDIYSLGAVMYFALLGQVPPDTPDLAAGTPLPSPRDIRPDISVQIQHVLLCAMSLHADQRYQSADEMRQALHQPATLIVSRPAPTVICPRCGHSNGAGEIYCQGCAQQLAASAHCPRCNHEIPTNSIFCPTCGQQV